MLLIDKRKGISSFDCIRALRKERPNVKFGHAGTLDPLASGLLIVLEDEETKDAAEYLGLDKVYEVEALIGERRTTGDMEGEILEEKNVAEGAITKNDILRSLDGLIGTLPLPVPIYSAVKQNGETLYKKARRGETVVPPVKEMEIKNIEFKNISYAENRLIVSFVVEVGSGTYIRSLVEELGNRLGFPGSEFSAGSMIKSQSESRKSTTGFPATTYNLRRIRIGKYSVENARAI